MLKPQDKDQQTAEKLLPQSFILSELQLPPYNTSHLISLVSYIATV